MTNHNTDPSTALAAIDFGDFFTELHGTPPFGWQTRLAAQVVDTGRWPDLLDLPTGTGKTAAIDIALFALALRPEILPRRIVFVVDRRVVVSQAAERARAIADRLAAQVAGQVGRAGQTDRPGQADRAGQAGRAGRTGPLAAVAARLLALTDGQPVHVAELRGGIARETDWTRRPDQPTVLVSTVDQVGSRLLFRGYGVSAGMRPVHAGLLGNDCLFLLDEVHLARPFAETLRAIGRRFRPASQTGLPERWQVVELSATPGATHRSQASEPFRLDATDRDPTLSPTLTRRLGAAKPATLETVRVRGRDSARHRATLAARAAEHAVALLSRPGVRTVGVVVNRVDTAVAVYRALAAGPSAPSALLLTGRMRDLDRDRIYAQHAHRLRTGRERREGDPPLVLVATQTVEAGADLDLDALVTECAPIDALVQRFGRVDRDGSLAATGHEATSVILATSTQVAAGADDPVYGMALAETWGRLTAVANGTPPTVDVGIDALAEAVPATDRDGLTAGTGRAPALLPSHLDRWVQTSITVDADPDPALWLHGLQPPAPDCTVVWRADVTTGLLATDDADADADAAGILLELCPPTGPESMQVPVRAVRRWLAALGTGAEALLPVADVESGGADADESDTEPAAGRTTEAVAPYLLWTADGARVTDRPGTIRPGATIVVPASYGGITAGTWDPMTATPVEDLGSQAQWRRKTAVLRLWPHLDPPRSEATGPDLPRPADDPGQDDDATETAEIRTWLEELRTSLGQLPSPDPLLTEIVTELVEAPRWELHRIGDGTGRRRYVLRSRPRRGGSRFAADSEATTSAFLGVPVTMEEHLSDVGELARRFATACGLPDELAGDLATAGRLHDLGKADPRFQTMLREGRLGDGTLLAKSAIPAHDKRRRRRAAELAGYPVGTRHELLSVTLASAGGWAAGGWANDAHDPDLVLHLVAAHHGWARPFTPVEPASEPVEVIAAVNGTTVTVSSHHGLAGLGSGVAERFWKCARRYGPYGLAWLEAILRLADHRASEAAEAR